MADQKHDQEQKTGNEWITRSLRILDALTTGSVELILAQGNRIAGNNTPGSIHGLALGDRILPNDPGGLKFNGLNKA